ncbi:MAG: hypothetical protein JNJ45_11905 [Chthonomonas sp.]|nr:hypothetical protein [Chthonomonas sp.]
MQLKTTRSLVLLFGAALATGASANLSNYTQNFDSLNAASPSALSDDGWKVFGNVFNPSGGYLYGYGTFPAPNGTAGFCSIAGGEGGPNQGSQYINCYSDYNNGDHANGNRIEANVFQEQIVGVGDLGKTYRFTFDYKASFTSGPSGSTVTQAFIKVLNPNNGYSLDFFPTITTTSASNVNWSEGNFIDVPIQSSWTGNILQFGFLSNATSYQGTGVYYDNISFMELGSGSTIGGTVNLGSYAGTATGSATVVLNYQITDMSDAVLSSGTVSVMPSGGSATYSVPAGSATGNVKVKLFGGTWLKRSASTTVGASNANIVLPNGNVTTTGGTELVDIADYSSLAAAFDGVQGDGTYVSAADLNKDAIIDIADYSILAASFDLTDD